jgi:hypothetical protein
MGMDMRSLSRQAKFDKRVKVIELRHAGRSYVQIALQVGLSRTGVFDICKRHDAVGVVALRDARNGRANGQGRVLTPDARAADSKPDHRQHTRRTRDVRNIVESLCGVARLIERRLGDRVARSDVGTVFGSMGLSFERAGFIDQPGAHTESRDAYRWLTDRVSRLGSQIQGRGRRSHLGQRQQTIGLSDARPTASGPGARPGRNCPPAQTPAKWFVHDLRSDQQGAAALDHFPRDRLNATHSLVEFLRRSDQGCEQRRCS